MQEALRELGADGAAGPEEIRRAYLRLIKSRKPESDPEGFQRARQAYEVARAGAELETIALGSEQRYESETAPEREPSHGAAIIDGASGASDGPATSEAAFEGFATAWRALPLSADPGLRVEIAREAIAALPADPRARWMLVRSLSGNGNDAALAEALRGGWKAGWPEFLEALLLRLPGRASGEEIEAGLASERPGLRLAAAAVAAQHGDGVAAAQVVVQMCAAAGQEREPLAAEVPVGQMLHVILALHEAGAVEGARRAHAALTAFLHESGQELALAAGPSSGAWILAGELARLPVDFPSPLRRAFASATRAGDLESAIIEATNRARASRRVVKKWPSLIRATAPNVAASLDAALARARARRVSFRPSPGRWAWLALLLCSGLVRMFTAPSRPARPPQHVAAPHHAGTSSQGPERGPVDGTALQMAEESSTELCGAMGARHGQLICGTIDGILAAIVEGNCGAVADQLQDVGRVLGPKPSNRLEERVLTRLHVVAWQGCGRQRSVVLPEPGK